MHSFLIFNFLDDTIPTTVLDVPNTERGHCLKTITIFKYLSKKLLSNKAVKWIALTDDDTLLRWYNYTIDFTKIYPTFLLKHLVFLG